MIFMRYRKFSARCSFRKRDWVCNRVPQVVGCRYLEACKKAYGRGNMPRPAISVQTSGAEGVTPAPLTKRLINAQAGLTGVMSFIISFKAWASSRAFCAAAC